MDIFSKDKKILLKNRLSKYVFELKEEINNI
jgi:hypothetical protein